MNQAIHDFGFSFQVCRYRWLYYGCWPSFDSLLFRSLLFSLAEFSVFDWTKLHNYGWEGNRMVLMAPYDAQQSSNETELCCRASISKWLLTNLIVSNLEHNSTSMECVDTILLPCHSIFTVKNAHTPKINHRPDLNILNLLLLTLNKMK